MHMMDDFPLLMSTLYQRAVNLFPDQKIVSIDRPGNRTEFTYQQTDERIRRLATALDEKLGVNPGGVIGTFAWNNQRHHEIYWATANTGRICHTINIRLFTEQIVYIVNHAQDEAIFVGPDLVPLLEPLAEQFETVRAYVILDDQVGDTSLPGAISYEDLIQGVSPQPEWPLLDERSPMMYCYTSGTTGNSKGVAYTQRSTYLHTISNLANVSVLPSDNVLPVVPMFHAAAWGYPFMATTVGAQLTYPGPDLSPEGLVGLIETERVTYSAGVPTVWLGIQQFLAAHPEADVSSIRAFLCGGSAVPRALIEWFWNHRQIKVTQGWGMTETNPVGSVALLKPDMENWDFDRQLDFLETAGLPVPGLEIKIVDQEGNSLPHDGEAFGELLVCGPWVAAEYIRDSRTPESFVGGWFRTGDVCRITPEGYIRITDRAKDVIKSGGEWISSLDLENALMGHPAVAEATVVGLSHPQWGERPVALVVLQSNEEATAEELLAFLVDRVAKWWLPDRILFVKQIPKTGTGKFDKKLVREQYAGLLETV